MPDKIELFEFPPTRSNRALWAMAEAGLPVSTRRVDLTAGEHQAPEFRAINPLGYVPVMKLDGLPIIESSAITIFAAELAPEKGLIPPVGSPERAEAYQWAIFAPAELDHRIATITQHTLLRPPEQRNPAAVERARELLAPRFEFVSKALEGKPFIVGEFSIADIAVGHSLAWAAMTGSHEGHPALVAYLERLLERPAFREVYGTHVGPMPDPFASVEEPA